MAGLYQLATLVFVGGSLIPRGGHNILEPAAYGKAIFVGPHMFNFKEDIRYFDEGDALIQVSDKEELTEKMKYYLLNQGLLLEKGKQAQDLILKNQGALQHNINEADYLLTRKPRILLVRLSAIGDVIHAMPVAHAVKQKYPLAEINWLVEDRVAGLVDLNPYIDNIIVMPRKEWQEKFHISKWQGIKEASSFLRSLKSYNFDIVLDMHGIFKSALPTGMTRAAKRYGSSSAREGSALFYNQKIEIPSKITHKIDRNLHLTREALGVDINKIDYGIHPGNAEKERIAELLSEYSLLSGEFVVINPFTTWETKNWPLGRYIELAVRVKEELDYEVIFTGGPGEREVIDNNLSNISAKIYNFAGLTNLRELAELYKRAKLYIGGDTGPMHLAVAVSLPVVSVMGPTDPEEFGPYGEQNIVLRDNSLECIKCHKRKCDKSLECMRNITVEQVFSAVKKKLISVKELGELN
ncbi:MAG: lipopolysaccharide heptosyltransferase I [Halanaerobiales bacterium]